MQLTRKVPIDFHDVARQSGLSAGTLCKTAFGWGVQNTHGLQGPSVALIEPPPFEEGEVELRIRDDHWRFYGEKEE